MITVASEQAKGRGSGVSHPGKQIVAHPEVRTLVNGEYLVFAVDVVYDLGELDNLFGIRPARGTPAHSVRRHYSSHLSAGPVFSCKATRRHVARKITRDLTRFAANGITVVGEHGAPFSPDSVTSLIRF